ncbi:MAG: PKD domain-containing protein [Nitrospirae bacterium]|nr:PKD domain-containing protein [Nitrospirota bacterium]
MIKRIAVSRSILFIVVFIFISFSSSYGENMKHAYDDLNRLIWAEYSDWTVTEYQYDEVGNREVKATYKLSVNFSCSPTTGMAPLFVTCTDLSNGNPFSWLWNFGDSSTSSSQNPPIHNYKNTGAYSVSLSATYPTGPHTATKDNYINVQPCPNQPVKNGTSYYSTLQAAQNAAVSGNTLQSQAIDLVESLTVNKTLTLDGGYNCEFTSNPMKTTLKGNLTIDSGIFQVTIGNFILD